MWETPFLWVGLGVLALLGLHFVCAGLCRRVAERRGYEGFFGVGMVFGLLGLWYVSMLPDLVLRAKIEKNTKMLARFMVQTSRAYASMGMTAAEDGYGPPRSEERKPYQSREARQANGRPGWGHGQ